MFEEEWLNLWRNDEFKRNAGDVIQWHRGLHTDQDVEKNSGMSFPFS